MSSLPPKHRPAKHRVSRRNKHPILRRTNQLSNYAPLPANHDVPRSLSLRRSDKNNYPSLPSTAFTNLKPPSLSRKNHASNYPPISNGAFRSISQNNSFGSEFIPRSGARIIFRNFKTSEKYNTPIIQYKSQNHASLSKNNK